MFDSFFKDFKEQMVSKQEFEKVLMANSVTQMDMEMIKDKQNGKSLSHL